MTRNLTKAKVAPRWRPTRTPDRAHDARLAVIGAGAALFGSIIGAASSVVIAHLGFQHDVDKSNRSKAESAYTEYAAATDNWFKAIAAMPENTKPGDPARATVSEYHDASTEALARVTVYGDVKVQSHAQDVQAALFQFLQLTYGPSGVQVALRDDAGAPSVPSASAAVAASRVAQGRYFEVREEYLLAIRADLDVD